MGWLIRDDQLETAVELVEYLDDESFKPTHYFDTLWPGLNHRIFRGQPDASWELIASGFREGKLDPHTPQPAGSPPEQIERRSSYLGWHLHAELAAVFRFMEAADRQGLWTPLSYSNLGKHYELVSNLLNNQIIGDETSFPAGELLVEFALAQHHGVPTRLLDWTESPWPAAFFAAYMASNAVAENRRVRSDRIGVFYTSSDVLQKKDNPLVLVSVPRHDNTFLRAQGGVFTHMPDANSFFLEEGRWPSVRDLVRRQGVTDLQVSCVSIPSSEATSLLRELYSRGITLTSMMPDLSNAAKECNYVRKIFNG